MNLEKSYAKYLLHNIFICKDCFIVKFFYYKQDQQEYQRNSLNLKFEKIEKNMFIQDCSFMFE